MRRKSIILILLILLPWPRLASTLSLNLLARRALHALHSPISSSLSVRIGKGTESCRASWFYGLVAQARGDELARDAAWRAALHCDADYILLLWAFWPEREDLAAEALRAHPEASAAWFWAARFAEDPKAYYRRGLALNPRDGRRWKEYGDLLQKDDPEAALEAYLQSCFHGDPGWNGCWQAGNTALRLGRVEEAITYYRYSGWLSARQRADELEAQLANPALPPQFP